MYKYFVFFNYFLRDGGMGIGNTEVKINREIDCIEAVRELEEQILEGNEDYTRVVISNYITYIGYSIY